MPPKQRNKARSTRPAVEADAGKRARILDEAAKLFRQYGYAVTTLRQIADATGMMAGSIYYHFSSKEEILVEVLDTGIRMVQQAVQAKVNAVPPDAGMRDRIAAAIEGHLYGLLHHGEFTSANIRIYGQIPQSAKDRHRVIRRQYANYWDRLFTQGRAAGEFRPDVPVSVMRLFVLGSLNFTVEWYDPERSSFESFARHISALVFDGIVSRGNPMRRHVKQPRRIAQAV